MELQVYSKEGVPTGRTIQVSDQIFGADVNDHVVYLAVQSQLTNNRQGTASTKTRHYVSGGGKKPWRQKGRGTARSGSSRSPIWRGGATAHGPIPHPHVSRVPKRVKRLARISVLSAHTKDAKLKVMEDFTVELAKTKEVSSVLNKFGLAETKTLVLLPEHDEKFVRASRNIKNLIVSQATDASTYDLLNCQALLIMESAVKKIEEGLMLS